MIGKWLVHKDALEGVDYDLAKLVELWDTTNLQDRDLCELNQRGVNSPAYAPGPYSEISEALVHRFTDYYCTNRPRLPRRTAGGRDAGWRRRDRRLISGISFATVILLNRQPRRTPSIGACLSLARHEKTALFGPYEA